MIRINFRSYLQRRQICDAEGEAGVPMMRRGNPPNDCSTRLTSFARGTIATLLLVLMMAACHEDQKAAPQAIRPVRTVTVELQEGGEKISLTGEIQPRYQADLGFRVSGKILERPVDVGTQVRKDDLLARLDPQQYKQDLEVAKSEIAVAEAEVTRSQNQEYRQRELLKNGYTTQVQYDQALKTFKTAQAQLDAARARQIQASENLGYTELKADNNGVITAIGADPGQVVSAGADGRPLGTARGARGGVQRRRGSVQDPAEGPDSHSAACQQP
jgi:multidrug efflux pump subunit AcrA (membrane-fusion protein)